MSSSSRLCVALRTGISRVASTSVQPAMRSTPSALSFRSCALCPPGQHSAFAHQSMRRFHASPRRFQEQKPEATAADTAQAKPAGEAASAEQQPTVDPKDVEIERLKKEAADFKAKFMYAAAQVQNVQRSAQNDVQRERKFGIEKFAKSLLVIADNLDLALANTPTDALASNKPLADLPGGVRLTQDELLKVFKLNGVEQLNPVGQKFDPNAMQGLMRVADPTKTPGTVLHVAKIGYKLNDRVIRAADVVIVAEAPAAPAEGVSGFHASLERRVPAPVEGVAFSWSS
eukprot:TRINITY_DN1253_c0_g2_i6.p1 TRINITY_DN1253_c0_g2~~TRINITY_DN1253_c0_g2_i6.p1  ORF type:complete len:287 (-),score=90.06 TRINITY_DN1253_c0_g2_i6:226-1086(-)